jgi:protein-S-isoprenylcysteine O-methyltransferase Ste14
LKQVNARTIAAIVAIIAVQSYYVISEARMTARTTRGTDNSADRGTRRLVWIFIAVAFDGAWLPVVFGPGRLLALGDWLTWVGVAMMICGIAFRRYVISFLGKFFTATVQIRKDHQLIKDGPYRYIRHPSYLGILILALGNGIALANWISLLLCIVLPATGIIRRIRVEEKELYIHFGEQYQDYSKRTWRIIPHIY